MPAHLSLPLRAVLALALLLAAATPAGAVDGGGYQPRPAPTPLVPGGRSSYVPGELVVGFAPGATAAARQRAVKAESARSSSSLGTAGVTLLRLPARADVRTAAARLAAQPGVLFAEPNYLFHTLATPDDPLLPDLWGLNNAGDHDIDAPAAWSVTTGSADVVVAVVDSGVDYQHPDLAPNLWTNPGETADGVDNDGNGFVDDLHGWDFVGDDNDPTDPLGHGTHVAGIIGARGDNGEGITGVAWTVSLMPIRAGDANGNLANADVVAAFHYACAMGAQVVNASFGGPDHALAVRAAIEACPGALFVVAAGNEGENNDTSGVYPCGYNLANIVCVAATDRTDALADFSNFGSTAVDLAAPGVSVLSATPDQVLLGARFESGLDGFVAHRNSGRLWSQTMEASSSGSGSATDSAGTLYSNSSETWIETAAPVDLSVGSGCALDYAFLLDLEQGVDYLVLAGSKNGGDTWHVIDSGAPGDLAWSISTDGAWVDWSEDLTADGFGGTASFDLLFELVSDSTVRRNGVHLDDVALHCLTGTHGATDFVHLSGTSMAAPHVAGVAALMLAAYPDATVAELKAALLAGVDKKGSLTGKVASGGRLNARGALDALDDVRPVAKAPQQALTNGSTTGTATVPVRVSWPKATDAAPSSGIATYQLQQRTKVRGSWRSWKTVVTTAARTVTVQVTPGTQQFRVRARDHGGNWSRWKGGSAFTLKDPQAGSSVTFAGNWSADVSKVFYDRSSRFSRARGASVSHTFTGRQVAWVSSTGPDRGRARVYVDGSLVQLVDLYAGSRRNRRVVFLASWDSVGTHTIKVTVVSRSSRSSGSRVDLDAFLTLR